jgi:hypothetical protein
VKTHWSLTHSPWQHVPPDEQPVAPSGTQAAPALPPDEVPPAVVPPPPEDDPPVPEPPVAASVPASAFACTLTVEEQPISPQTESKPIAMSTGSWRHMRTILAAQGPCANPPAPARRQKAAH